MPFIPILLTVSKMRTVHRGLTFRQTGFNGIGPLIPHKSMRYLMDVRTTQGRLLPAALLSTVLAGAFLSGVVNAQEKIGDPKLPVLPKTTVEATPTPSTTPPEPTPPQPPSEGPTLGNPITNGGVFGSPSVQGYKADSATSGTKVDMPLIDYPGTLSVIPIDVIRDQSALTVDDILRDIPSAIKLTDFANLRDNFILRGFEVGSRDFRWNGYTDPSYIQRDFFNIERVEVLSGPASVLYGAGSPSGLINFITKQPLSDPLNSFQFTFGSFNLTRYAVDTTGPIDDDGRMLYRVNAAYQQADSFRDFGWSQRTAFAPVFTFLLDENTSLTFEGSYQDTQRQLDTGLIFYNGAIQGPITRSFNEPNDLQRVDDYKAALSLNHKFDDYLSGRIGFFVDSYNYTTRGTMPDVQSTQEYNNVVVPGYNASVAGFGLPLLAPLGPTQILRDTEETHLAEQFYDLRAELNAKVNGFFFKHNALVGAEFGWYHSDFTGEQSDPGAGFNPFAVPATPPSFVFNYANPNYNLPVASTAGAGLLLAHIAQERYGLYFSDMIELNEYWKLLVGARYDIVNTDFANSDTLLFFGSNQGSFPTTVNDRIDYYLSPRVGLVFQPIKDVLSFYGTYIQSFDPPVTGVFATPNALLHETGTSGEIGMKLDLFEKKLSLQLAGYIIDKHNVVAQENFITSVQIGEIRSSGAEFSAVGKVTRDLSIIANYAYCDSRIISDPADQAIGAAAPGNRFRGVPYNNFNIWARYNLIANDIHTLGVGVGVVYVGDRFGDLADSFVLPAYTRVDAGVFYKRGPLNASVYIENLGNTTYYSGSFDANTVTPGNPINFRFTLGVTF
jgi:iron complex outermembrane recepter protein